MTRKEEINKFIADYVEQFNRNSYESYAEQEDIAAACSSAIEWAEKRMIDKAWEWLEDNVFSSEQLSRNYSKRFREAMEK